MLFRCKDTLFILYLKTFHGKKTSNVHFSSNTVALPLYIYNPLAVFLAIIRRTRQTLWGECTDANLKTVAKRYMIEKK